LVVPPKTLNVDVESLVVLWEETMDFGNLDVNGYFIAKL